MATVIQSTPRCNDDHSPRWDRTRRAELFEQGTRVSSLLYTLSLLADTIRSASRSPTCGAPTPPHAVSYSLVRGNMTRPLRRSFPGALSHLTARGNARQAILLDRTDRQVFLDPRGRAIDQQGWRCYASCGMDNHDHLLIETPDGNLVQGMRRLHGVSAQHVPRRHQRVGHLLQGRYKRMMIARERPL